MLVSVIDIPAGHIRSLETLEGDQIIAERLLDLGFHPGVEIEFMSRMPLGGPVVVRIGASLLALREEEALCLKVNP